MDALWQWLTSGHSNFFLYALLPTVVVNLTWVIGSLVCLGFDAAPGLRRFKIQAHVNGLDEVLRCARHSLRNKVISEIPLTFAAYPIFVWLGIRKDPPLPGLATVLLTLGACLVVEDAWHYFAHRSLHNRWAFDKIHHLHHHYQTPFGLASSYAHPLETLYTGFGTVLPMLLLRPHLSTMLVWVAVKQLQAIAVHSGYQLPFRPSRYLPFLVSAGFHDRHHRRYNRNYAPNFVWWDRMLGTADEKNLAGNAAAALAED